MNFLNIFGLLLGFAGTIILTFSQFVNKKEAIRLGGSYWMGSTDEENEKLPQVQNLLKQSRNAKIGFIFLAIGFLIQLISEFVHLL